MIHKFGKLIPSEVDAIYKLYDSVMTLVMQLEIMICIKAYGKMNHVSIGGGNPVWVEYEKFVVVLHQLIDRGYIYHEGSFGKHLTNTSMSFPLS